MIDTDKYEAYKPTQSNYQTSDRYIKELLTEVKRLRGRHVAFMQWMLENYDEIVNEWEASDITEAIE
jgi:hypothetical protein